MSASPVYLTTHQVARMLGVSLPTVVNWIKAGRMDAHKTPGGHRRIAREELLRFAREFNYPLPPELQIQTGPRRILVVDGERDFSDMVVEFLELRSEYEVRAADGAFSAGLEVGRFHPDVILLDLGLPHLDAVRVAGQLDRDSETRQVRLIGVSAFPDPVVEERARKAGFRELLRKPVSLDKVAETIHAVLEAPR